MFSKISKASLMLSIFMGLMVTGCGRFEVRTSIERIDSPAATQTPVAQLPVTSTPLPALPAEEAAEQPTVIPPATDTPMTVAAAAGGSSSTATPFATTNLNATYLDEFAGISLDYPSDWEVLEPSEEQKASASTYATTFQSWASGPGGGGGIPEGGTKFDLLVQSNSANTLEEALNWRRTQIEAGAETTILAEESVTLASGLHGVRIRTESVFGEASEVISVANGHVILFSGIGDEALLNQILQSLRSLGTSAEPFAPGAEEVDNARMTEVSAVRIADGLRVAPVYGGHAQSFAQVAQIPGGMTVSVSGTSDDGGWYRLAGCGEQNPYRPAPECWLSANPNVVQPVRAIAPSQQPVLETDTAAVLVVSQEMAPVHSGPDASYPVISQLAGGFSFGITGVSEDGNWWRLAECSSPLNEVLSECWISADPGVTEALSQEMVQGPRPTALPPTEVPQRAGTTTLSELPQCLNLDTGGIGADSDPTCEFTLRGHEAAGTLLFEPVAPARFGFGGVFPEAPTASMCAGSQNLHGSSEVIAPLATHYVCYQTGEGRFGYLHFTDMSDEPLTVTLEWHTFDE